MYHILDWIYFFSGHELFNFIFVKTDGGFSDFSFQRIGIFGFAGLAKFFSSAFRFLHCTFWWLVQFAGFLQFSLLFSGFWQNMMMAVVRIFLCNAIYGFSAFAKEDPVQTLCFCCCAQLNSGIKFHTTLVRQQVKHRVSVAPTKSINNINVF